MIPKLFKESENEYAAEFKKFLPVNVNFNYDSLAPSLAKCENKYIVPVLGSNLFDKICQYYNSTESVEESLRKNYSTLLEKIQFSLIRLAMWSDYDILSVMISDKGAASGIDQEKRLYRRQEEALKETLKNDGFDALDDILSFLEKEVVSFPDFKESSFYTQNVTSLIRNTAEFNSHYNINDSRLIFLKMKYFITDIENIELSHRLGSEFVKELVEADRTTEKYKKIINLICRYVVYSAIAAGYEEIGKLPTDKGLIFETSSNDSSFMFERVGKLEMKSTQNYFSSKAEQYISSAIEIMKNNKTDYPAFITFAGEDIPSDEIVRRDNTDKKTVFL